MRRRCLGVAAQPSVQSTRRDIARVTFATPKIGGFKCDLDSDVLLAGLNVLIAQAICINVIFCLPDDRTQAAREHTNSPNFSRRKQELST